MKFQKIVISLLAAIATPVFAQSANFQGLSAAVGLSAVSNNLSSGDYNYGYYDGYTEKFNFGKTQAAGVVDVAYLWAINPKFLVGVGATYQSQTDAGDVVSYEFYKTSAKAKNHYSIYVQPTYAANDSLGVFGKIAYHHAKLSITETGDDFDPSNTQSKNVNGVGYGVGAIYNLDKNVFLRAEFEYVSFSKGAFENWGADPYHAKLTSGATTLSVGYRF